MKTKSPLLPLLTLFVSLCLASSLPAADAAAGELLPAGDQVTPWLTEARAAYPLKTCLISGEELGGMGEPADYIYRQSGQPDQLVRFCCKMCVAKFKKDPAKYLAQLSAAAKTEAKPASPRHP
jgi:YHS domain-containing protein